MCEFSLYAFPPFAMLAEKMNAMVAEGNLDFLCHAEPQTLDDIKQDFIRKQEYKQKLEIAM